MAKLVAAVQILGERLRNAESKAAGVAHMSKNSRNNEAEHDGMLCQRVFELEAAMQSQCEAFESEKQTMEAAHAQALEKAVGAARTEASSAAESAAQKMEAEYVQREAALSADLNCKVDELAAALEAADEASERANEAKASTLLLTDQTRQLQAKLEAQAVALSRAQEQAQQQASTVDITALITRTAQTALGRKGRLKAMAVTARQDQQQSESPRSVTMMNFHTPSG